MALPAMEIHRHPNGHLGIDGFNTVGASQNARNSNWDQFTAGQFAATRLPGYLLNADGSEGDPHPEEPSLGAIAYSNLALFFRMLNHFSHLYTEDSNTFWQRMTQLWPTRAIHAGNIRLAVSFWERARAAYTQTKRHALNPTSDGVAGMVDRWCSQRAKSAPRDVGGRDDEWAACTDLWHEIRKYNREIPPWSRYWQENANDLAERARRESVHLHPNTQTSVSSMEEGQCTPGDPRDDRGRDRPLVIKGRVGDRSAASPTTTNGQWGRAGNGTGNYTSAPDNRPRGDLFPDPPSHAPLRAPSRASTLPARIDALPRGPINSPIKTERDVDGRPVYPSHVRTAPVGPARDTQIPAQATNGSPRPGDEVSRKRRGSESGDSPVNKRRCTIPTAPATTGRSSLPQEEQDSTARQVETTLREFGAKLQDQDQRATAANASLAALDAKIKKLDESVAALNRLVDMAGRETAGATERLQGGIDGVAAESSTLAEKVLSKINEQLDSHGKSVQGLEGRFATVEQRLMRHEMDHGQLAIQLHQTSDDVHKQLQAADSRHTEELHKMQKLMDLHEHMQSDQRRLGEARDSKVAQLERENGAAQKRIGDLDRMLSEARQASGQLQQLQQQMAAMKDSFQQQLKTEISKQQPQQQMVDVQASLQASLQDNFRKQFTELRQNLETEMPRGQLDEATRKELADLRHANEAQRKLVDDLHLEVREHRLHIRNQTRAGGASGAGVGAGGLAQLAALQDQVAELRKHVLAPWVPMTPETAGVPGGRSSMPPGALATVDGGERSRAQKARILGALADMRKDGSDTVTMSMDMVSIIQSWMERE